MMTIAMKKETNFNKIIDSIICNFGSTGTCSCRGGHGQVKMIVCRTVCRIVLVLVCVALRWRTLNKVLKGPQLKGYDWPKRGPFFNATILSLFKTMLIRND
jgi:hypothetical protein